MIDLVKTQEFTGTVVITVAYFGYWYYLLLFRQRGTKYRLKSEYESRGEVFDRYFGQDPQMLSADRAVSNTQEQMVPFLSSLWLYAVFGSPAIATVLGAIYLCLRSLYPLLLGPSITNVQSKRVYWVTLPCYFLVFYMLGASLWSVL